MNKTAVEEFADLAGRARADLRVLENRRKQSQETMDLRKNSMFRQDSNEYYEMLGKKRALNSAITNMQYFIKAIDEAHAREVCRDLKAMPAEKVYGKWCTCGSCTYWKCNCYGGREDNLFDQKECVVCKYKRPIEPKPVYGRWCECKCGMWNCKCRSHEGYLRHSKHLDRCSTCRNFRPKESL